MENYENKAYEFAKLTADSLKKTEAYKNYINLKQLLRENGEAFALVNAYKAQLKPIKIAIANSIKPSDDDIEKLNNINTMACGNEIFGDFILAETKLQNMIGNIFETITTDVAPFE